MKGPSDPYEYFARYYDSWQAGFSRPFSEAILPFYEREILRLRVPDRSLIDIACGTGTFLRLWDGRHPGWTLTGTDGSREMLRVARRKRTPARLLHLRMDDSPIPVKAGVAVSVFDSVNHILRTSTLRRSFRAIAGSILPGGILVFDVTDERAFARLFSGSWTVESDKVFTSVTASRRRDIGISRFVIFAEERGKSWRRVEFEIRERNWHAEELRRALSASGLSVVRVRSVLPYSASEVDAPRALWICRRPSPSAR